MEWNGTNSQKSFTSWDWIGNKKYTLYLHCGGAEMDEYGTKGTLTFR